MPIDVEERARDLAEKMANFVYFDCCTLHDGPNSLDATYVRHTSEILELITAAVNEERERCAKRCEALEDSEPEIRNEDYELGFDCARAECALVIRSGGMR